MRRQHQDLWLGLAPTRLAADEGLFNRYLAELARLSAADCDATLTGRIAAVERRPTAWSLRGVAEALAARDSATGAVPPVSHLALGWLALAAARGEETAARVLTVAHLRLLRGWCTARGGACDPALLWVIRRCARDTDIERQVRDLMLRALDTPPSRSAITGLIATVDPDGESARYINADPCPGDKAMPGTQVPEVPGNGHATDEARLHAALRRYMPWLEPATAAIRGDRIQNDEPLLICGPSGNGQADLVARAAELTGATQLAVSAWDAAGGSIQSLSAGDADLNSGNPVFLIVEGLDALDARDSAILAGALEGAGFLPGPDGRRPGPSGRHAFLLADRETEVVPILRERTRTVAVRPPGAAHAQHALWLVGTERANRVGFGGPDELNVSAKTWRLLEDRLREGASLEEIRILLYHAVMFEDPPG